MKQRVIHMNALLAVFGMAALIFDANTAVQGARTGIEICIQTVVPALFPFFILSSIACSSFLGKSVGFMKPLCKLCGVPNGAESLLLLGFLGGYPVGAQCINEACANGSLDPESGKRMLGFCNNAGPSFIFGMTAQLFQNPVIPWLIWLIQITSALLVGMVLPQKQNTSVCVRINRTTSIVQTLERSVKTTANICGWIILFRVLIAMIDHWFLSRMPELLQAVVIGILDLANGCVFLHTIQPESIRFLICTVILTFGGLCVGMQTAAVTKNIGTGLYFPGKALQTLFSLCLSIVSSFALFSKTAKLTALSIALILILPIFLLWSKFSSRNISKADV